MTTTSPVPPAPPAVPLTSFKQALNRILDHIIEELDIKSVPISSDKDFYWDMTHEALYDMDKKPDLDVGRLSDDWHFLSKVVDDPEQGVALVLIHAAPLLRFIGEKIGQ